VVVPDGILTLREQYHKKPFKNAISTKKGRGKEKKKEDAVWFDMLTHWSPSSNNQGEAGGGI